VLSNREHVIALKPLGKGLLGTTLRYPYELRDEEDYFDDIPSARVSKDMVDLAEHLLDTKASKFNPDKFKDKYESALKALVKRKAAGKTIEVPEAKEKESNVINLMEALKQASARKNRPRPQSDPRNRRLAAGSEKRHEVDPCHRSHGSAFRRRYPGGTAMAVRAKMGRLPLHPFAGQR
jgi:DNA end-binding protein Ku